MIQNFFILTSSQRDEATEFNAPGGAEIDPRAVDNASPGVGINLNDDAGAHEAGEAVPLSGKFVAPERIVDDPSYSANLKAFLLTLPWATLETETIFAPPED